MSASSDRLIFHTEIHGNGTLCTGSGSTCIGAFQRTSVKVLDVRSDGWIAAGGNTNAYGLATGRAIQTACYCSTGGTVGWIGTLDPQGQPENVTYLSGHQLIRGNFGTGSERVISVAFDNDGNLMAAGTTGSPGFPVTPGAYQMEIPGCTDICSPGIVISFFSRIDGRNGDLITSTLYGGSSGRVTGYARDPESGVWLFGEQTPFLTLLSDDASTILGTWHLPTNSYPIVVTTPTGFATIAANQADRYEWNSDGPRVLGIANVASGNVARGVSSGDVIEVLGSGFPDDTRLFFDGVLAEMRLEESERLQAVVPHDMARASIIEMALVSDGRAVATIRISTP